MYFFGVFFTFLWMGFSCFKIKEPQQVVQCMMDCDNLFATKMDVSLAHS